MTPDERRARFEAVLPEIRYAAWQQGYAIGVHGTLARDFDLIAAPWIERAASAEQLAEAIHQVVGGELHGGVHGKPHGRVAWVIHAPFSECIDYRWTGYIDLSVMPRG